MDRRQKRIEEERKRTLEDNRKKKDKGWRNMTASRKKTAKMGESPKSELKLI